MQGLIIICIIINWIVLKKYRYIKEIRNQGLLLICFFLIISFSFLIFNTASPIDGVLKYASFLFLPLVLIGHKFREENIKRAKIIFVLSSLIFVLIADIYALIDILITKQTTIFILPSIYNKYSYYGLTRIFNDWHPTYVAFFLNVSLLLIINLYSNRKKDFYFFLLVIFVIINVFLLNSLIAIIALFIFPFLYSTRLKISKKSLIALILSLFILSAVVYVNPLNNDKLNQLINTHLQLTDDESETNSLTLRLVKWKTAIDVIKEQPITGVGMPNVKEAMVVKYLENGYLNCARYRYSPHNQYLTIFVSTGVLGFLFFLFLVCHLYFSAVSHLEKTIVLMFCLFCLTEEMLSRQQGIIFFALFYSFVYYRKHIKNQGKELDKIYQPSNHEEN